MNIFIKLGLASAGFLPSASATEETYGHHTPRLTFLVGTTRGLPDSLPLEKEFP